MIKRLWPYYFKNNRKYALLSMLAIFIEVVTEVVQPVVMAQIIDKGIPNKDMGFIVLQGVVMIVLACVSLVAGVLGAKYAALAGVKATTDLRHDQMNKIQTFSFYNIDHFSTASLVTRLTSDVSSVQQTGIMALRIFTRAPLMILVTIVLALRINIQLSFVLIAAVPFLALGLMLVISVAFPRFKMVRQSMDAINQLLQENFIGIRVVKAFVREDFERSKFNTEINQFKERSLRAMRVVIFNGPLMQLTIYACTLAIMWVGGNMVIGGAMTTGELLTFISYIGQILMSLMMISFVFIMLTMSKSSAERIFEVIDTVSDIQEPTHPKALNRLDGSLSFENVHFSYGKQQTEEVLNSIDFSIQSGKVLGIIGPTGSGKTTLVQLISRLYDTTQGKVSVAGQDVREYTFKDLREHVGVVLQKNTLFSGTIRENLMWGNACASEADMIQAATNAQAHQFISQLPDGYETHVEQGGSNFSGGQRQRLCIARALVKKPAILILDDSTSAVDTATDYYIRQALYHNLPDTTVIIVAQRISSIQDADHILVLEDGKMTGFGTHDQLLQTNALYQDIYHTQTKGDVQ